MKHALLILSVVAVVTALPATEVESYHGKVGIKLAERIKQIEQAAELDGSRVRGYPSGIGEFPYMAGLVIQLTTGELSLCGGTLISNTRALTAAHCWYDRWFQGTELTVVLGSLLVFTGGLRIQTSDVVTHPNYNVNNYNHDIAVIRMGWVKFTNIIQPIKLPFGDMLEYSFEGATGVLSGYGTGDDRASITAGQYLSDAFLPIISNEECQSYYPANIIDSHICTSTVGPDGPTGPCLGDDGSPLTYYIGDGQHVLIGLMSFRSAFGCVSERPAVYTRVTSYVPWIQAHM